MRTLIYTFRISGPGLYIPAGLIYIRRRNIIIYVWPRYINTGLIYNCEYFSWKVWSNGCGMISDRCIHLQCITEMGVACRIQMLQVLVSAPDPTLSRGRGSGILQVVFVPCWLGGHLTQKHYLMWTANSMRGAITAVHRAGLITQFVTWMLSNWCTRKQNMLLSQQGPKTFPWEGGVWGQD